MDKMVPPMVGALLFPANPEIKTSVEGKGSSHHIFNESWRFGAQHCTGFSSLGICSVWMGGIVTGNVKIYREYLYSWLPLDEGKSPDDDIGLYI